MTTHGVFTAILLGFAAGPLLALLIAGLIGRLT